MADSKPRKALIVAHGFPPSELGGTELYSYSLANCLRDKGIDVSVFTRLPKPLSSKGVHNEGYVIEDIEGLRVYRAINSSNALTELLNPHISRTFRNVILKEEPEIIHFQHLVFLSADLPEIAASHGIPGIMTFHDYWFICPRVQLLNKENKICDGPNYGSNCAFCFEPVRLTERFLGRLGRFLPSQLDEMEKKLKQNIGKRNATHAAKVIEFQTRLNLLKRQFDLLRYKISPSHHLIERYEKEQFKGFCYLPHGFSPVPRVDVRPAGKLRIGYMGNINYPKGLAVIIDELYRFLQEGSLRLVIYGQPYDLDYFNRIRERIKRLPPDIVELRGRYRNTFEDLWKIFSSFDVLVFPSVWEENAPIVLREALLAGRPVVASDVGGVPEVVKDMINGLLFDPFKSGDLQGKVRRLLEEPGLLERLAAGARETEIDTMEEHADSLIGLYGEAMKNSGSRETVENRHAEETSA